MKEKIITVSLLVFAIIQLNAQNAPLQKLVLPDFTIEYPTDWTPDTSGNMGSTFFLYSPLEGEDDTFSENVNLIIQLLPDPKMTEETYIDETVKLLPVYFSNYKLGTLDKVKKNKKSCHVLEYSGMMNNFELHFKQYIWVMNGKSYLLSYTAEGKSYGTYEKIATQVMESLKFK